MERDVHEWRCIPDRDDAGGPLLVVLGGEANSLGKGCVMTEDALACMCM